MAKKQKKNSKMQVFERVSDKNQTFSEQCEEKFLVTSKALRKIRQNRTTFAVAQDFEKAYRQRRIRALHQTIEEARGVIEPVCSSAEGFDWQKCWVEVNAMPVTSYDLEEEAFSVSLGAALWMLDELRRADRLDEALKLMPNDDEIELEALTELPEFWDPGYSIGVIASMRQVIFTRNEDCEGVRQKESSICRRVFMDAATLTGKQKQEVPSRKRFAAILDLIPEERKEAAVSRFTNRFWDWTRRYFLTRLKFFSRERELEQRIDRLEQQINEEKERQAAKRKLLSSQKKRPLFLSGSSDPLGLLQERPDERQTAFRSLDSLLDEMERKIEQDIQLTTVIGHLSFALPDYLAGELALEEEFPEDVLSYWEDFSVGDPFEGCFALLALVDSGSDLPWLYYPGTLLTKMIGTALPWYLEDYEAEQDPWENHGEGEEERPNRLEAEDWYERRFRGRETDSEAEEEEAEEFVNRNLSQLVYRMTGVLMPRRLGRLRHTAGQLRELGVTEEQDADLLMMVMTLLGEMKHRASLPVLMEEEEEETEEIDSSEEAAALRERISQLKKENDRLKAAAYEAGRSLREARKQAEEQEQAHELERQELVSIRELLFARQEESEGQRQEEPAGITFPCGTTHRIVSFGGHDSWAREIRQKLPDVRFVERDKLPNSETIRNADVVWIQSNALSHAYYYRIIDEARRYSIPVRYFSYASAVKCAEQLVEADREMS